MKFIRKGRKPASLRKFERENLVTPHLLEFDALPAKLKASLAKQMLKEQGCLCAYTMRRIGLTDRLGRIDFHFEHIQPRSHRELQLDFKNLVLCAPGENLPDCDWGAKAKKDAEVEGGNFVSPLRADCETRFLYSPDGFAREALSTDTAAKSTVKLLNLNHEELVSQRIAALGAFGLGERAIRPLGGRAAERLAQLICERNAEGGFEPFCIAIKQVASRLANKARQRSARMRAGR